MPTSIHDLSQCLFELPNAMGSTLVSEGKVGHTTYQLLKIGIPTEDNKICGMLQLVISGNGTGRTQIIHDFQELLGEPTIQITSGEVKNNIKEELTSVSWTI